MSTVHPIRPAAGRFVRMLAGLLLVLATALFAPAATAQVSEDWGTVATPITSQVTFSFAQYNITSNFSHEYTFTLEGSAGAAYSVSFQFDACRTGCGNAVLSYGIGSLSESPTGTYVLAPGTYTFSVTGTGMGSGNSVDYWGSVVISPAGGIVAPVPEPEIVLLALPGALLVLIVARRRKAREAAGGRSAPFTPGASAAMLALPVVLLSACSEAPSSPPTQVVARVGDTEISAAQLELAMNGQRGPFVPSREQIVDKLVDRELAVQQALARKLDRQPDVVLRLEELRREVLAAAYAEQVSAGRPRPTEQQVKDFYADNQELFAQRKIYRLRELTVPAHSAHAAPLKDRLVARQSFAAIAEWLARERATFTQQDVLRAAEQVPLSAIRKLSGLSEGQWAVFEAPQSIHVYQVLGWQSAPLTLAEAKPLIAAHLVRQEGDRAVRAELKQLRDGVRIEVVDVAAPRAPAPAVAVRERVAQRP